MSRKQRKNLIRILAATVLLILFAFIPAEVYPRVLGIDCLRLAAFLIPYCIVGWDVLYTALRNLLGGRLLDEKFLMALATVGAFALGEYVEGVAVMLLYQVGELFQSLAVGRSRKSIAALMDIRPDTATVLRDGEALTVFPEEVAIGELLRILPGERIPLDGTVTEGESQVNTAALTGESLPQEVKAGDRVISGAVNMIGVLTVRAESPYAESTVAKILDLVENAAERKARVEAFITRFAHWYTPVVVGVALLLAVLPPIFDGNWGEWIGRALIFLVVSCPCALVISVPLSFFGGIGGASRRGILIKGAEFVEVLSRVHTVAFDKTGTLTEGHFRVSAVYPQNGIREEDLLALAASAECRSHHPIARSVLAASPAPQEPSEVKEQAGLGIAATVNGSAVLVGNATMMQAHGVSFSPRDEAGTLLYVAENGEYRGAILLADEAKQGAKEALAALKKQGVKKTVMLTGDRRAIGEAVAGALGVDIARCELLPADKVSEIENLLTAEAGVAYVGDGINDAPVLSRADVGIAMGALGSDAAIEAADVVLMDDNLAKLPEAIRISRKTMAIVRQNIVFAIGVKLAVLVLGALGLANMWIAIFADVGVMVLAILNAMRAMRLAK